MTWLCGVAALASCTGVTTGAQSDGAEVEIDVVALTLPDATDVLYNLTLENGASAVVWAETDVSANQYGTVDGSGSFTYFGPCDADLPAHTLTLEVASLTNVPTDDWVDPGPLTKTFTCAQDATTRVGFDVTLAIDGEQGFADITVDFDDIYCSASVTCDDALLQGSDGARMPTATVSLTCTAGPDPITGATPDTALYMDDLEITCTGGDGDAVIDPAPTNDGISHTAQGAVSSHSVSRRQLNGIDDTAIFWRVSLGMDTTKSCDLHTAMTASNGDLTAGTTPADTTWPVIDVDVTLTDGTAGTMACGSHLLTDTTDVGDVHVSFVGDGDADGTFDGQTFQNTYNAP